MFCRSAGDFGLAVGAYAALITVWAAILTEHATTEGLKLANAVTEVRTTADHLVFLDKYRRVGVIHQVVAGLSWRTFSSDRLLTDEEFTSWYDRLDAVMYEKGGLHLPQTVRLRDWFPVARKDRDELRSLIRNAMRELETPVKDIPWDEEEA